MGKKWENRELAHEDKSMTGLDIRFCFHDQFFVTAELQKWTDPHNLVWVCCFGHQGDG